MANWREAAEKFRTAEVQREAEKKIAEQAARDREHQLRWEYENALSRAESDFKLFLASEEGEQARALLRASGESVRVLVRNVLRWHIGDYRFSPSGISRRMDCPADERGEVRKGVWEETSPREMIDMFCRCVGRESRDFMPWLREELDKIAAAAPEPTKK